MKLCLLILFLLVLVEAEFSNELKAQNLPFRSFSIEQGLSESVAQDLLQDHNGYIWVATGYGLNELDGTRVRNYYQSNGLNDNQINTLYEDERDRLWIGSGSGINVMENDSIRTLPYLEDLMRYSVQTILQDEQGEWWFGTESAGVWLLDRNQQLTQYSTVHGMGGNSIRKIVQSQENVIWFATDGGLTSLDSGNFTTYTSIHGLPDNSINDVEIDESGKLWLATGGGMSIWDGSEFINYTDQHGLIENAIHSISLQEPAIAWLGTDQGASRFENGTFTNYSSENGLSGDIVYSTLIDREGHIWLGTLGGGTNIFLGDYFHNYSVDSGLSNDVITAFVEDADGQIWIATYGGGIVRYNDEGMTTYYQDQGLADNQVFALYRDSSDRIWVGARNGISLIVDNEILPSPEHFPQVTMVRQFFEDPDTGEFWIATYNHGVLRYDGETFYTYNENNVLENNTVMSIVKDGNGRIWFGTYGGATVLENGEFRTYTIEDGLPGNGVIDVFADKDDTIWFTTFNGFARYEEGQIESYDSSFGLSGTISYFMFQGDDNYHWIGTNIGIIRFDYQRYFQADTDLERDLAFRLVTRNQGLISNEMNAGAVYKDDEGSVWLGSVEGISRFFPNRLPEYTMPPVVHIEEVIIDGEMADPNENRILSHTQNFLQFEFTGISFEAPARVLFEYRMIGIDSEWTRTYDRSVRYPSLSPGGYQFQLRAYNSSGVRSEAIANYRFEIRQPVWFQWWFLVCIVLLILGSVFLIYKYYRARRMVDIERMRVQIASDLHDDVGASLTELALQTDFIRTGNLDETVENTLKQIGDHSRRIVSTLDDIVWSIDSRNDTIGDLTDRMQDHVNRLLGSGEIQVNYDFSELSVTHRLSVQVKENLYMIFKEAIHNIIKHSNATEVEISLAVNQNRFKLIVKDNGTTRLNGRKSGQGIRNMNMRAKRINAKAIIEEIDGFIVTIEGNLT